ncbi:CBS domain-containing protein [Deinococcus koreensis]|uniref:CBS domain-containing protein n=1 Tax=Deinococcus koreensis TaxID=2054903 RepID=A0A2K3UX78_9DEIO|nr:CBS domain-containing protein [Deinococcus koreensis]PNY81139.1 CBS domain-containing protein [Deinococcus koreensis]
MPTLRDIMTRELITTDAGATLKEVASLMAQEDIGTVLIMDGDELRGIITDRDIVVRAVAYGHDLGSVANDYATGNVFSMDSGTDVTEAAQSMAQRQLRRLPATEGGRVVGIVSLGDLSTRTTGNADQTALEGISADTVG